MLAIVSRLALVVVAAAGLGLVLWQPWTSSPPPLAAGSAADAAAAMAGADAATMSGFGGEAQHGVRYEMPAAAKVPPIPAGASDLRWADLWADGRTLVPSVAERIGMPDRSLFPEGSTAEDVKNFFLDIGDMRSLQPQEGAIRPELDGRRVRLAGYTTPVGFGEFETRFLLVPELGACIHVPPPPPNQIVYVERAAPVPEMFAAVWVTGTLRARPVATILADVGYQLEDVTTAPYE